MIAVFALLVGLSGCGSKMELRATPVNVSGKVLQSGRPLGGLVMILQPLGDGHVKELPIRPDGTFAGELIAGEYAYYVARPMAPTAVAAARRVSPQYFEANLARKVNVEPGGVLAIALD